MVYTVIDNFQPSLPKYIVNGTFTAFLLLFLFFYPHIHPHNIWNKLNFKITGNFWQILNSLNCVSPRKFTAHTSNSSYG